MPGYSYNASALGLGAVLRSGGVQTVIPSQASVALAPSGGLGSSVVENYNHCGISFTRAETRVFGSEISPGVFTTYSDVYVTNLNVFDRLKVALMSATISSTRDVNSDESRFEVRTAYRGIGIGDCEVIPEIDLELTNAPTYRDVLRAMGADVRGIAERWGTKPENVERAIADPRPVDPIMGSLMRDLRVPEEVAKKRCAHVIEVPGLGAAYFAEFVYKPGRRRLNLLRIELGNGGGDAPVEAMMSNDDGGGDLTVGSVEGNGTPPTGP